MALESAGLNWPLAGTWLSECLAESLQPNRPSSNRASGCCGIGPSRLGSCRLKFDLCNKAEYFSSLLGAIPKIGDEQTPREHVEESVATAAASKLQIHP